jgi:large-conductance mechanosensitive channel
MQNFGINYNENVDHIVYLIIIRLYIYFFIKSINKLYYVLYKIIVK